jgi:sugar lactone lactonase YvrE
MSAADVTLTEFEILAEGLRFPEGPVWCADGSVMFVEIARERLARVRPLDGGGWSPVETICMTSTAADVSTVSLRARAT